MSFLTGYMEAMLAAATDPREIELRRMVLDDHLAMVREKEARDRERLAIPDMGPTGD